MLKNSNSSLNLTLHYFFFSNNTFFRLNLINSKKLLYVINSSLYYYFNLMLKYSSSFYKPSLIELFFYEVPSNSTLYSKKNNFFKINSKANQYGVTLFFLSNFSTYLYLFFSISSVFSKTNSPLNPSTKLESIENLFFNANWLERESSEMTGIFFSNKLDSRNLLMMYGDSFYPMLKYFTSVGLFELFYNVPNDVLIKSNISLQN